MRHQRGRVATTRGANVLENGFEIEMAMLGIDDDPVEVELDGNLGDRGRLERDPQAARKPRGGEFFFQRVTISGHAFI